MSLADEVILLPIYPARERPIEGVTSEVILGKMKLGNKQVMGKQALLDWIKNEYVKRKGDQVLVTAGAGDIDTLVTQIQKILTEKK